MFRFWRVLEYGEVEGMGEIYMLTKVRYILSAKKAGPTVKPKF